ncbi:MAG: acetate--CoA ligase family protein [Hyphomicrobiaceae bacterium]|nr:acetate--CoA ligase family protein [Hyphomicrobiaceae bacterium]
MATPGQFEKLFNPCAIAIIGASQDLTRISGQPIKALKNSGFKNPIYLVNPKYQEIHGLKCFPSAVAIGKPVDMAVIAVPAPGVAAAIRDCGRAGIGYAIVLTAGFRESGSDGVTLEADLKRAAIESGVRVIGPNCQGMLSIPSRVWACFGSVADEVGLREGNVSCVFQSGGFGYAIVNLAEAQGVGFRVCVSSGNEADMTTPELVLGFLDDPGTKMAFAVMEGTPDARRLLDVGRKSLEMGKPVLIWKSANTEAGAKAAASHTANMTGRADLYRAAFRQSGLIEVDDVEPIVDIAKLVAQGRLPKGNRIGALSISGGSGIVFADRCVRDGLVLPPFSATTVAALKKIIPSFGSSENPADVTASIFNDMGLFTKTLEIVLQDPELDQLTIMLASIPGTPALRAAEAIVAAAAKTDKPVHVAWSGRRARSEEAYKVLEAANVPIISTPVRLAEAAAVLARFAADRRRLLGREAVPGTLPKGIVMPKGAVTLSEAESKALLAQFGVPVTREVLVPDGESVLAHVAKLAPPFAVKVVSRDIAHKSDVGGVKLGLKDVKSAAEAAREVVVNALKAKPNAKIDGVLVAEMAGGIEALIGVVNDPSFGPCVALGLGGVLTEVLKDVTFRVAPFSIDDARDMIGELKGAKLFAGYRGSPAGDVEALAQTLVKVGQMADALKERIAEMDINPVFVGPKGVVAADALIILK